LLLAGLALAVFGCDTNKAKFQAGIPGTRVSMAVAKVTPRMGVLDTVLHAESWTIRTYLPPTDVCRRVVSTETGVSWVASSAYGTFERDGERCDAVGIGSLIEWRNKRGRPEGMRSPVLSGAARFQPVYEDEEFVFLRGRFPQVGHLGWSGGEDTIAVVPNIAVCQLPIERGRATIEYFVTGKKVLTLGSDRGRCPIVGLIRPSATTPTGP
jgi:hypothetical protein